MNSLRFLLTSGILIVATTAPLQVVSFSPPHHLLVVSRPLPPQSGSTVSSNSRRTTSAERELRQASLFSTFTSSTLAAEGVDSLANIHSLDSITTNPHLFPITSDYLHALSRLQYGDSGISSRGPSAEEFLNQLSRELLLLSHTNVVPIVEQSSSEAFTAQSINRYQPSYHAMEVTTPAFTSTFGVGVAAQTYEPAFYSQYNNPMMSASNDGGGNSYGVDDSAWYEQSTATNAPIDNIDVAESYASWQKSQGGSNPLRDLALSIPTDDTLRLQSQQQLDYSHAATMHEMNNMPEPDYFATNMLDYSTASDEQYGGTLADDFGGGQYAWDSIGDHGNYYHDNISPVTFAEGSFDGTVAVSDQASLLPEVNYDLSNSLTTDLSNLNYEDLSSPPPTLHHNGGLLSDVIKSTLDQLGLPTYHVELPVITNPLSQMSPSMQNAVLSIKEASGASREKFDGYFNTISHSLDGLTINAADTSKSFEILSGQISKVADAGASGLNAIGNALQVKASNLPEFHPPNLDFKTPMLPNVDVQLPIEPNVNVIESASAVMHRIGDTSLSDFGHVILSTIELTGGIIFNFLDLFLNTIAGTNFASVIADVQSAISSLIDNASHFVVSTVSSIGNMSVIEIIQNLLTLVIAITDILLKLMNAIVYLISGNDGATWALVATSSVKEASSQLLAQASSTYNDFTHASLAELALSIGDYGQVVENEFVTLMGSLGSVIDTNSFHGMSVPEDVFDSVATVLQTGLSL
ncbi:hypothetical protein ACHAXH_006597 [Discostella pseudostelligera]